MLDYFKNIHFQQQFDKEFIGKLLRSLEWGLIAFFVINVFVTPDLLHYHLIYVSMTIVGLESVRFLILNEKYILGYSLLGFWGLSYLLFLAYVFHSTIRADLIALTIGFMISLVIKDKNKIVPIVISYALAVGIIILANYMDNNVINWIDVMYTIEATLTIFSLLHLVAYEYQNKIITRGKALSKKNRLLTSQTEELATKNKELNQSNKKLQELNQEMSYYINASAHHVREPLRNLRLHTQYITKDMDFINSSNEYSIKLIQDSAFRLYKLYGDLEIYSLLTKEEDKEKVNIDINTIVKKFKKDKAEVIYHTNSSIIIENTLPTILMNEIEINQLFCNLLNNAIQYRDPDRKNEIHIGTKLEDDCQIIWIDDDGIGVPVHLRDSIFTPFTRLHSYVEREGSGLGLAICRRIMTLAGGDIAFVDSDNKKGIKAELKFPYHLVRDHELSIS